MVKEIRLLVKWDFGRLCLYIFYILMIFVNFFIIERGLCKRIFLGENDFLLLNKL